MGDCFACTIRHQIYTILREIKCVRDWWGEDWSSEARIKVILNQIKYLSWIYKAVYIAKQKAVYKSQKKSFKLVSYMLNKMCLCKFFRATSVFQVSWSWDKEHHSWQMTQEGVLCASISVAEIKLISHLSNFTFLGVCNVFLILFFCLRNILSRTLM